MPFLCKRDPKDAFRKIQISLHDYWLFLFEWEGKLYVDIFLPFGLRIVPFIFNLFGEGLHWILESFGRHLVHYLDDFFLFNAPDPEFFGNLASYLRLAENLKKRKDAWVVDFTEIELDSDHMIERLPKDKHDCTIASVQRLLKGGAINHHTLEKRLGFLSFCAKVVQLVTLPAQFVQSTQTTFAPTSTSHSIIVLCGETRPSLVDDTPPSMV